MLIIDSPPNVAGVELEFVSPECKVYYPPANVDVSVNNLALRPDRPHEVSEVVPLAGALGVALPVAAIFAQIQRKEATPVYDAEADAEGNYKAHAPTRPRRRVMQTRLDKMKSKGYKLVKPPVS